MKYFFLFLSSVFFISICFAQQGKINLIKGQKFSVDNKITAISSQTVMGQSMETNAVLNTISSIEVKDVKADNYDLINTFTKMKAKISAMGTDMNFDSDKKEDMEGEYAASFKNIINKPKQVIIDKQGKIISIDTMQTYKSAQADIMKMMVDQFLGSPEETGYGVSFAFVSIPSKIITGYKWTDSSSSDGIKRITLYTVKDIKEMDAIISITGNLNTDVKSQMQGMDIVNKSNGTVNGEETVDIATGIIKQKTTVLNSKGSVSIVSQSLEIPMTTTVTSVSSVKLL